LIRPRQFTLRLLARAQMIKSFLLLFFKKEVLPFLPDVMLRQE
jgi:hypothetical protein